jgi:hypothetical protein
MSLLALGSALAPAALAAADQHLLYIFRAPKDRDGFRTQVPSIEVHDIADGHRLVRTIPLPAEVKNIRGVAGNAATRRLYVAHYGSYAGEGGHVVCLDLVTNALVWRHTYASDVDRGALTPDGRKLFMPSGEGAASNYFYVIDAATGAEDPGERITVAAKTHNTVASLDGRLVFMSAFGADNGYNWLHVVDARTNQTLRRIGPCAGTVRPFTINGKASLAFITTNALLGFQVGEVATGRVLFTAKPPASYAQPAAGTGVVSHGISLSADERQCYVVDQSRSGIHVFDVSGLPAKAPVWKKFIDTHGGREKNAAGGFLYGETGIYGQPGWIISTIDGRYQYPETGEIIDSASDTVVGQLKDADGTFTHSRFGFEVVLRGGVPIAVGDQFGVGRVTAAPANRPPTVTLGAPGGLRVAPADLTAAATAGDSDGRVVKVEFFVNGTLRHTENGAPWIFAWNDVPAGSYTLTAKATDDDGASTVSAPVGVTVSAANRPPAIALVVPAGARNAPADIAVSANASDPDGRVAKVEFFVDGALRRTELGTPYTFPWNDVPAGSHRLYARATDDDGATTTTATVTVTVNAPPAVALAVAPGGRSAPADVALSADASDRDGTIARVEFLVDGVVRHTEHYAPYAYAWNDVPAGTYSVRARAWDDDGAATTSAAATVTVTGATTRVAAISGAEAAPPASGSGSGCGLGSGVAALALAAVAAFAALHLRRVRNQA